VTTERYPQASTDGEGEARRPRGEGRRLTAMRLVFSGQVIEWRGPAPYYFVPVPDQESEDIREVAAMATYGWGVIPVEARIGEVVFVQLN
jgi:hypothetical protein